MKALRLISNGILLGPLCHSSSSIMNMSTDGGMDFYNKVKYGKELWCSNT